MKLFAISKDAEKAFGQIQHHFMIKNEKTWKQANKQTKTFQ